jgi:hypothetical protein
VLLLGLVFGGCVPVVDGQFAGRTLAGADPQRTVLLIYNHGFSRETAGTYVPRFPPILQRAVDLNPDVVLFSQVRNVVVSSTETVLHHAYIEEAINKFSRDYRIPMGQIILTGQSCGGWGSLLAALANPDIGGVLAFAPTCHGKLPHSAQTQFQRRREIDEIARRARFRGTIFLYEGDSYYHLSDWDRFETVNAGRAPGLRIVRLSRAEVLKVCPRCSQDSHNAFSGVEFAETFFTEHLPPLVDHVRGRIGRRSN